MDNSSINVDLAILGNHAFMHIGETCGSVCPACGGGKSREMSFRVTRLHDGFVYVCHRATCGAKGFVPNHSGYVELPNTKAPPKFIPDVVDFKIEPLSPYLSNHIIRTWGLTPNEIVRNGFKAIDVKHSKCIWMPIFNPYGAPIGGTYKSLDKHLTPKSKTYWFVDEVKLYYPIIPFGYEPSDPIYVVEDVLSAIRVGRFVPAVALLGSHMTQEQAVRLASQTSRIILMLDKDTWEDGSKGAKIKQLREQYRPLFEDIGTIVVPKDPKDMLDENLLPLLES